MAELEPHGAPGRALNAAIESALLDLERAPAADVLPDGAGVGVSATLPSLGVAAAAEAARQSIESGFETIKVTAGAERETEVLVERIRAIRAAIGSDVRLRLEVNGAWDLSTAEDRLSAISRFDIEFVEQPLPAHDVDGLAELRRRVRVPIAADEAASSVGAVRTLLAAEAVDVLVLKPARVGGPAAVTEIAERAAEHGIPVVIGTLFETGIGLAAGLAMAAHLPDVGRRLVGDPARPRPRDRGTARPRPAGRGPDRREGPDARPRAAGEWWTRDRPRRQGARAIHGRTGRSVGMTRGPTAGVPCPPMPDTPVSSASSHPDAPATSPLIHARGLTKRFGDFVAVDAIDFDVARGESFGFLGPNGAGKTSTMRMIGCVSPISEGTFTVMGMDPATHGPKIRAHLGVVPQQDTLDVELTVRENLSIYGRYFGLSRAEVRKRADELLEFAQLTERADDQVEPLSGGMKRRLTIARSLINEPTVLLLDEPTTGLDPQARHLLWDRLYRLKQQGVTLVLTTHYMDEAEQLCDRLVVMDKAKIVAEGSPRALIEQYSTREVTELRFAPGIAETLDGQLDGIAERIERLPDRVLLYADDGEAAAVAVHQRGLEPETVLVRRSSLEDVFLRLTGRSLIE